MKFAIAAITILVSGLFLEVEASDRIIRTVSCSDITGLKSLARFRVTSLTPIEIEKIVATRKCGDDGFIPRLDVKIKTLDDSAVELVQNTLRAETSGRIIATNFHLDTTDIAWINAIKIARLFWSFSSTVTVDEGSDCSGSCSLLYVAASQRHPFSGIMINHPGSSDSDEMFEGRKISDHIADIYRNSDAERALNFIKSDAGKNGKFLNWNGLYHFGLQVNEGSRARDHQRVKDGCGEDFFRNYMLAENLKANACKDLDSIGECVTGIEIVMGINSFDVISCRAKLVAPRPNGG